MINRSNQDFEMTCSDILTNDKFSALKHELHHGISRYDHSMRVAKLTYRFTKFLHMKNAEATTRAALLHDFYVDSDFDKGKSSVAKLASHPQIAAINAKKYYNIGKLEENIIKSHMFPMKGELPKYKESWVVSTMDKTAAVYEMCVFKFNLAINILLLFIFNLITIQR